MRQVEELESQIKSLLSPYDTFGNYDHTLNMKAVVQKIRQAIDEARE